MDSEVVKFWMKWGAMCAKYDGRMHEIGSFINMEYKTPYAMTLQGIDDVFSHLLREIDKKESRKKR